jgi:hypothetical protein
MQLAKREKYLISLAVIVVVFALVIELAIMPFVEKRERYATNVTVKQMNLQEMVSLRQEYLALQQDAGILAQRLAGRSGPFKESLVEMKLEKITLGQMVGYLKLIESPGKLVSIKRISIQTNKKETQYLDAILQVLTFTKE